MDALAEGLLEAVWETLGVEGFATAALVGLVGIVCGPRQGLVLVLGLATISLVAERDEYFFYEEALTTRHVVRSASLIEQLDVTEEADRAERILLGRRRQVGARALLEEAMNADGTSADESGGVSPYRRMARILANGEGRDRSWAVESPFRFLTHRLERTSDPARRAILMELLFATGHDEVGRIWRENAGDPEFEAPVLRGLDAALAAERMSRRLRAELVEPLAIRLVGEPASDDPRDPTPASVLIALDAGQALRRIVTPEVLDDDNPRLAEALRALTDADLVLGVSVHEQLIENLGRRVADEPWLQEPLTAAIAMLALRADEATRERLEKLRAEPMMKAGAERGLALMARHAQKRDGASPSSEGEER